MSNVYPIWDSKILPAPTWKREYNQPRFLNHCNKIIASANTTHFAALISLAKGEIFRFIRASLQMYNTNSGTLDDSQEDYEWTFSRHDYGSLDATDVDSSMTAGTDVLIGGGGDVTGNRGSFSPYVSDLLGGGTDVYGRIVSDPYRLPVDGIIIRGPCDIALEIYGPAGIANQRYRTEIAGWIEDERMYGWGADPTAQDIADELMLKIRGWNGEEIKNQRPMIADHVTMDVYPGCLPNLEAFSIRRQSYPETWANIFDNPPVMSGIA